MCFESGNRWVRSYANLLFQKRSTLKIWKRNPGKPIVDPYRKRYVSTLEIGENDIALAASEFPSVDLDHDDGKQDEIDILTDFFNF